MKAQVVLHFNFVSQETPCCGIALNTNKHLANELTKQWVQQYNHFYSTPQF